MSNNNLIIRSSSAEFLIFDRQIHKKGIEVRFEDGDLWLTQKAISELYNIDRTVVTKHLKNIFDDYELDKSSVCAIYAHTAKDGKTYKTNYYNLDAVISVGYRANSDRAIQFRRWATNILKEFSKKGYIIDKKRMENGTFFDEDYYDSLLAEIREIRLSERRFYQKITDIYATSIDIEYIKKQFGKITISQFNCLACRLAMYILAIIICIQKKINLVVDGARESQLFAIEQEKMIEHFKKLFKEFNLEIIFPLLYETDDYSIKNQILAHGFVPKMNEGQCLLGMPILNNSMNNEILEGCLNVYHKELYPKIHNILENYKNIDFEENYL